MQRQRNTRSQRSMRHPHNTPLQLKKQSQKKNPSTRKSRTNEAEPMENSPELASFSTSIGEKHMPLVTLVLTLIVVGVLLWLVNRFIPMQGQIKGILNGIVVIAVCVWLLKVFGLFGYLTQFQVGHL
jgi:hypothetical protein